MTLRLVNHQYIDLRYDEAAGLSSLASQLWQHREKREQKTLASAFAIVLGVLVVLGLGYFGFLGIESKYMDFIADRQRIPGADLIVEDFSSNARQWSTGTLDNEDYTGSTSITNGRFIWTIRQIKKPIFHQISYHDSPVGRDFYVSVEVGHIGGPPGNFSYGIIFRETSINDTRRFYVFEIRDPQDYRVAYYDGSRSTELQSQTEVSVIRPSGWNQLEIVGLGNRFKFYINGEEVSQVDHSSLRTGSISLFIAAYGEGNGFGAFDNFRTSIN